MGKKIYRKPVYAIPLSQGGEMNELNRGLVNTRIFYGLKRFGTDKTILDILNTLLNFERSTLHAEFAEKVEILFNKNTEKILEPKIIKNEDFSKIQRIPLITLDGNYSHIGSIHIKDSQAKIPKDLHHKIATFRGGHSTNSSNLAKNLSEDFHHHGIHGVFRTLTFPEKIALLTSEIHPNAFQTSWLEKLLVLFLETPLEQTYNKDSFTKQGLKEFKHSSVLVKEVRSLLIEMRNGNFQNKKEEILSKIQKVA